MKKKMTAALLTLALLSMPMAVSASEFTEDGSTVVPINATIASSYSVSIPASLTLSRLYTEEMIANSIEIQRNAGAEESAIAEMEENMRSSYISAASLGVKGNFPTTKAVVVVMQDATSGVDGDGNLTAAKITELEAEMDEVTTSALNSDPTSYSSTFSLKKESNDDLVTGCEFTQDCRRFASPVLNESDLAGGESIMGSRLGEMKAGSSDYATTILNFTAALTDADTYTGHIGFAFGLKDRT